MAVVGSGGTDPAVVARIASLEAEQVPSATQTYQMPTTAATTNAVVVTTASATLTGWQGSNVSGTEYWVKFYDKASAPAVGTDIPVLSLRLPTQSPFPDLTPLKFVNGIAMAITMTGAVADTAGVSIPGDIVGINIFFKGN